MSNLLAGSAGQSIRVAHFHIFQDCRLTWPARIVDGRLLQCDTLQRLKQKLLIIYRYTKYSQNNWRINAECVLVCSLFPGWYNSLGIKKIIIKFPPPVYVCHPVWLVNHRIPCWLTKLFPLQIIKIGTKTLLHIFTSKNYGNLTTRIH